MCASAIIFVLVVLIATDAVFANEVHDQSSADRADGALAYSPYDLDAVFVMEKSEPAYSRVGRRDLWSRIFWDEDLGALLPNRPRTTSTDRAHNPRVQVVPMGKRTLPLDLQKALFAHGIIGRRRR